MVHIHTYAYVWAIRYLHIEINSVILFVCKLYIASYILMICDMCMYNTDVVILKVFNF